MGRVAVAMMMAIVVPVGVHHALIRHSYHVVLPWVSANAGRGNHPPNGVYVNHAAWGRCVTPTPSVSDPRVARINPCVRRLSLRQSRTPCRVPRVGLPV